MSEHTVTESDSGIRLDRLFKRHFPQVTHSLLEKSLRKGDIRVDGKKAKASQRMEAGQVVRGEWQVTADDRNKKLPRVAAPLLQKDVYLMQECVLYKDADIIVINKPPGLAVQGGSGITRSVDGMLDALRFDAKDRPRLVHRLDRDTSGVLVLARSARVAGRLMNAFSGKSIQKTYWALVQGVPIPSEGTIDLALAKQEEGEIEKVAIDEKNGKRAVTHYRVLEALSRTLAWMELTPVTGRTHQLRVHMASIGHAIIADGKYGGKEVFVSGLPNKLHLHARRIVVPGVLDVTAPLPKHMQESWKTLGLGE